MKTIGENQKQIEAARKDYIARRKDQEFDSQGKVKSTETKEYEEHFIGPWLIERLVSKNGKPLSEGSYVEIHLNARVLFIHRLFNVVSTFSDYRKFRVDSKITGAPTVPAPKP